MATGSELGAHLSSKGLDTPLPSVARKRAERLRANDTVSETDESADPSAIGMQDERRLLTRSILSVGGSMRVWVPDGVEAGADADVPAAAFDLATSK